MMGLARPLENLIEQLQKLPTIGPKTAQRLALFILKLPEDEARQLAVAIVNARTKVFPCSQCGYLTDIEPCAICREEKRDNQILCVTQEASDVVAIERTGFNGRYYVLNRGFNLLQGNGIEDINLIPFRRKDRWWRNKGSCISTQPGYRW